MTESIRLPAVKTKPAAVALPGSKSISNRTLLLAALSDNVCEIHSLLKSDDTDRMLEALDKLGVHIESLPEGRLKVHGTGAFDNTVETVFVKLRIQAARQLNRTEGGCGKVSMDTGKLVA